LAAIAGSTVCGAWATSGRPSALESSSRRAWRADDALDAIAAVEPADALVEVPGNDSKSLGRTEWHRRGGLA
jgi:hypothetical protein